MPQHSPLEQFWHKETLWESVPSCTWAENCSLGKPDIPLLRKRDWLLNGPWRACIINYWVERLIWRRTIEHSPGLFPCVADYLSKMTHSQPPGEGGWCDGALSESTPTAWTHTHSWAYGSQSRALLVCGFLFILLCLYFSDFGLILEHWQYISKNTFWLRHRPFFLVRQRPHVSLRYCWKTFFFCQLVLAQQQGTRATPKNAPFIFKTNYIYSCSYNARLKV